MRGPLSALGFWEDWIALICEVGLCQRRWHEIDGGYEVTQLPALMAARKDSIDYDIWVVHKSRYMSDAGRRPEGSTAF